MTPPAETCAVHETVMAHQRERDERNTREHAEIFQQLRGVSNKLNLMWGALAALQIMLMAAASYFSRH